MMIFHKLMHTNHSLNKGHPTGGEGQYTVHINICLVDMVFELSAKTFNSTTYVNEGNKSYTYVIYSLTFHV